jgi:hypothetical protein
VPFPNLKIQPCTAPPSRIPNFRFPGHNFAIESIEPIERRVSLPLGIPEPSREPADQSSYGAPAAQNLLRDGLPELGRKAPALPSGDMRIAFLVVWIVAPAS